MSVGINAWTMSVTGWIMSPIVSRLLDKCVSFLEPDKDNEVVQVFNDILSGLKIALQEAHDSPPSHRKKLEKIVSDLKSAFYDIEDLLDDVEYHHHKKQIKQYNKRHLKYRKRKRRSDDNVGPSTQDIQNAPEWTLPAQLYHTLKKKVDEIKELIVAEIASKGETANVKKEEEKEMELTDSVSPWKVTGRDKDRDKIKQMLLEDVNPNNGTHLSAIGIYGVSGSGKTTLAQHVCADEKTAGHFDFVIWIHVSRKFSIWDVYKDMYIAASGGEKNPPKNLDILRQELEKKLENKCVLLVLDDIRCTKDVGKDLLPQLVSPLKAAKSGSKILATSRTSDAFSELGPDVTCTEYLIPVLEEEEFLKLFMYYALGNVEDTPDILTLKGIGAGIALKLKGLPLAARTVGGWLRNKKTVEYWRTVEQQNLFNETVGTLWWSYQNLDEQVRRCFVYCSIFPRRYRFQRDELVRLWVAEGFINTGDTGLDMDDVGWGYFHQLQSAAFMQHVVGTRSAEESDEYFVIHDLMHDLAEAAAGSDCHKNGLPKDIRHLFVDDTRDIDKICEFPNLRTLIIRVGLYQPMKKQKLEQIFKTLPKLRVLKMEYTMEGYFSYVPRFIIELNHLRYLGLKIHGITYLNLSEEISMLYRMQVLDISVGEGRSVAYLEIMTDLTNLRHVIGDSNGNFANIGRLRSLLTLKNFYVDNGHEYELAQLSELNMLRGTMKINGLENVESKVEAHGAKLADKKHLTGLELEWSDDVSHTPDIAQVQEEVLEGLCPPKDLRSLEINNYQGKEYPTWMVEENVGPNCLHHLRLRNCSGLVPDLRLFDVFRTLRRFSISDCNWDSLPGSLENLKWLERLEICSCDNLQLLPNLPRSLKKFELSMCDEKFMMSCKTSGEPNWEKIQHVDEKIITDF